MIRGLVPEQPCVDNGSCSECGAAFPSSSGNSGNGGLSLPERIVIDSDTHPKVGRERTLRCARSNRSEYSHLVRFDPARPAIAQDV